MSIRKEAVMDVAYEERVQRIPMSRAEFDKMPEKPKAEYVDGMAIVSPIARDGHNAVGVNLLVALRMAFPELVAIYERGVQVAEDRLRIPDVALQRALHEDTWATEMPLLVAEILSASTRREDLYRKTDDYRLAGIGQYWLVDRFARTVTILVNAGERWDVGWELTDDRPTAVVEVQGAGSVELGLGELLD